MAVETKAGAPAQRLPSSAAAEASASDEEQSGSAHRKTAMVLLGLAISAIAVYLVTRSISLDLVWDSLKQADYVWLIPATALVFLTAWFRAERWRMLFRHPEQIRHGASFGAVNIGLMLNNLLPGRAGEVGRIFALRRDSGLSAFEIGTTVVVERLLDLFVVALIGLCFWPVFPDRAWIHALGIICAVIVAGSIVFVALLAIFRQRLTSVLLRLLHRLPWVSEERAHQVRGAIAAGSVVLLHPRRLAVALLLSVGVWTAAAISTWVLYPAFSLDAGTGSVVLILVANTFVVAVPAGPGTIGVYEASIQASLLAYGVSSSVALSFALVMHAVNFFPLLISGGIASWVMGSKRPQPGLLPDAARTPAS